MDALSLHFSFQLNEDPITSEECSAIFHELPRKCIGDTGPISDVITSRGDKIIVASSQDGSHLVMQVYKHGLVTLDITFVHVAAEPLDEDMEDNVEFENIKRIENEIKTSFGAKCKYTRIIPARIRRGTICPYFLNGNDTIFESESSLKILTEVESKWQNIKIYGTEAFVGMLVLDDDIMIAESDDIYTHTILGTSRHSFKDKTVLILGGGDGGLLNELLKLSPKYVVMAEIDIEVIKACRKYMRKCCGSALDLLEGPNYKIRIEDCQDVLKQYLESGEQFDYVINDLSEYIINSAITYDNDLDLATKIMTSSLKMVTPGGKYLSRGCCITNDYFLEALERDVTQNTNGMKFKKFVINVPSFHDKYCIFEVSRGN